MRTLAFLLALFVTNLRAAVSLKRAFAAQVVFMALNNLIWLVIWWVLFQRFDTIAGWQMKDMVLLFGIAATGFGLAVTVCGGVYDLGRMVHEGELDGFLTQPKPVLLAALCSRTRPSGWGDVASGLALIGLGGHLAPVHLPVVALSVTVSTVVLVASGVVFHSLTFYVGRAETLARQLWEFLLSFSVYPEPVFSGVVRVLLFSVLPAGFVAYLPAAAVRDPSFSTLGFMLLGAAAYIAFALTLFSRGLRRYESGNRLGLRLGA
jgi:ABC-2 type transport system permease protein